MLGRIKLPQVTIFSADSAYVALTARALTRSIEQCEFGDAILCSDRQADGPFRHVPIEPIPSIDEYSILIRRLLPDIIQTPFVLIVQWDGFIINPQRWHSAFLRCDYIGALWPKSFGRGRRVGNGGFSLRSKRLIDALNTLPIVPDHPGDIAISHIHRPALEARFGIKFAEERLAERFSYELDRTDSFGFHGFMNMWRHVEDDELREIARQVWRGGFDHRKSVLLILDAYLGGRTALAESLYADLRQLVPFSNIKDQLARTGRLSSTDSKIIAVLEGQTRKPTLLERIGFKRA